MLEKNNPFTSYPAAKHPKQQICHYTFSLYDTSVNFFSRNESCYLRFTCKSFRSVGYMMLLWPRQSLACCFHNYDYSVLLDYYLHVSEIGAMVKVTDSHHYGWGSIPGKSCSFLIQSMAHHCTSCVLISNMYGNQPLNTRCIIMDSTQQCKQ